MKNFHLPSILIATVISSIISSGAALSIAKSEVKNGAQFKIVDLKKLSSATIERLKTQFEESPDALSPGAMELIAQNDARQMFEVIAKYAKNKHVIIPKSSAIFSPDGYEVTEEIAKELGIEGVKNDSFASRLAKTKAPK